MAGSSSWPEVTAEMDFRVVRLGAMAGGVAVVLLGLLVMLGWAGHMVLVVQPVASVAPMQFNTALCFVVMGAAILCTLRNQQLAALICCVMLMVFGATTLLEYVVRVDFGLGNALFRHYIFAQDTVPGRMAPNTAISFLLLGVGLASLLTGGLTPSRASVCALFASMVLPLAGVAFLGHMTGISSAYGWGEMTAMAPHTAFGLLVSGASVMALAWDRFRYLHLSRWAAFGAGFTVVVATFSFWGAMLSENRRIMEQGLEAQLHLMRQHIVAALETRLSAVRLATASSEATRGEGIAQVRDQLAHLLNEFPDFRSLYWYAEANGRAIEISAESEAETAAVLVELAREAVASGIPLMRSISGGGKEKSRLLFVVPNADAAFGGGWVAGSLHLQRFLRGVQGADSERLALIIVEKGENLYASGLAGDVTGPRATGHFARWGLDWDMVLRQTAASRQTMAQSLPTLFLLGGLLLSACFSGVVYLAQSVATRSHDLRREMHRRARMAQKLDSLNRNLERRVKERTEALSTANQALEEFTFMASHDLQEPLRKQRMFVGVLRHALDNVNLDERGRLAIEAIASASGRMERLVRDLLELSRTQRHSFTRRSVSMEKLASQAIELMADRAQECGAHIEKLPLPATMGDPTLIAQLYQNLLSNALKFRDAGRPLQIRLAAEHRDGLVVYTVEDNGIGVETELVATIFAPFKRGHSRQEFDGSGIGLAVCKRIIEHHEGQIWVESEAGKGSRFCFTLQAGNVNEHRWQMKEVAHA